MLKKLEYAYPSSTLGGKTGLWRVLLKSDDDILFDRNITIIYTSSDALLARDYFDNRPEKTSKYSL